MVGASDLSLSGRKGNFCMYSLPEDFDGELFQGRTLECVNFAAYMVDLFFDEDVGLTIYSSFRHTPSGAQPAAEPQEFPILNSQLMTLIDRQVLKVEVSDSSDLTLVFDNGDRLECFNDLPNYECYHIRQDSKKLLIIV